MLNIIKAVDFHLATVSLNGYAKRSAANISDDARSILTKSTRSSLEDKVCFLCEKEAPKSELRHAMTMDLDKRLNECARNLNDVRLMARLSGGDIVAQELKYHRFCLTALYNRERVHFSSQNSQEIREKEAHPIVFSELISNRRNIQTILLAACHVTPVVMKMTAS